MKKLISTFSILILAFSINAQSWTFHDINVFGATTVYDYYIDSNNTAWLATSRGLCEYDLNSNAIPTFHTGTNTQQYDASSKIIFANNLHWVLSNGELSSFNGQKFNIYSTNNGLLNNLVSDIAVDTLQQLWLASSSGVSYFNGISFVHDTTVSATRLAIDGDNRVFAFNEVGSNVLLIKRDPIKVKVGNVWETHAFSRDTIGISISVNKIYTSSGKIIILSGALNGEYYELEYPAQLKLVKLYEKGNQNKFSRPIKDARVDKNGKKWTTGNYLQSNKFYSTNDTILEQHFVTNPISSMNNLNPISFVRTNDNLVLASGTHGLYSADLNIKSNDEITKVLDINSIRAGLTPFEKSLFTTPDNNPSFEFPKGSGKHGIYGLSLMHVSKKQNFITYTANSISPYEINNSVGPVNNSAGLGGQWIHKVSQQEISNHINNWSNPNYIAPDGILNWNGNGDTSIGMAEQLAPYYDYNSNNKYEPLMGDYPLINGDEAIYWITHKGDFEYHGMLYGYNKPNDSAMNQTLFLQFKMYNRSNDIYDAIKAGLHVDFDLGNYADDYVGCDSLKNTFFVYNGDSFDDTIGNSNGYGTNPPVLGVKFLTDTMDGFIYYHNAGGQNGQPNLDFHWYNYLHSKYQNGQTRTYPGTSIPTKYLYTGFGTRGWSEANANGGAPNIPGDRKGLGHIPSFALNPGESKTIEVAIGYGGLPNGTSLQNKNNMQTNLDSAFRFWQNNIIIGIDEAQADLEKFGFGVYPNPSNGIVVIHQKVFDRNNLLQIYTLDGKLEKELRLNQKQESIDVSELNNGIYFLKIGNSVRKLVIQE